MAKQGAKKQEKLNTTCSGIFKGFNWCNYFANPTPTVSDLRV